MKQIAFVSYRQLPNPTPDDQLTVLALQDHEVTVNTIPWDAKQVRWETFDSIVVRSCWDYYYRSAEFLRWIDSIERAKARIWNPANILRWNLNKTYLSDLSSRGITIAPTIWLERGLQVNLRAELARQNWRKAVVKPTIGAISYRTWRTSLEQASADQAKFDLMLNQSGVMIQPFIEQITSNGEWSFIFFLGEYSHAVLKRHKGGDFRVQSEYGGYIDQKKPSSLLIEQAQRIVRTVNSPLLYARVDGVEVDGILTLTELELLEPALFLATDKYAARRFAEAILTSIG